MARATPKEAIEAQEAEKAEKPRKARAKKAPAPKPEGERQRRSFGRGWLANEVEKVLRDAGDNEITVGEITAAITNPAGEIPSSGAVAACLTRWNESGYIKLSKERPMRFKGFMAKWKNKTLDDFLAAERDRKVKARAAARAEKKAAAAEEG